MAQANPNNADPKNGNISAPITYAKFQHQQTEYQVFPEEFFSGSDVSVYFGDIYIDTITGLEFNLQEQLRPLYGYADYTYSSISRGNRLVQGTFRIAFKQAGYLFTILEHIAELGDKAKPSLAYLETGQNIPDWHASARQTIEDLLDYYYDPAPDTYTTKANKEVVNFDWPAMQMGAKDSDPGMITLQASKAGMAGAISHLQNILIQGGWTFPAADASSFVGLKQRFMDGDMWPTKEQMVSTMATYGNQTTQWTLNGSTHTTLCFGTNHPSYAVNWYSNSRNPVTPLVAGQDGQSDIEKALEDRLQQYTFLKDNDAMDFNGSWGKYTDLVRHGVALFQYFAEYTPDQSLLQQGVEAEWIPLSSATSTTGWGGWVDQGTANLLSQGLTAPTGVYDLATKQMVYRFQKDNGLTPTGICDSDTINMLSRMYNINSVTETVKSSNGSTTRAGTAVNYSRDGNARIASYEAEIWGRSGAADGDHNRRTFFYDGGFASSGTEPLLPKLKKTGFDIHITYGPIGVWALQNVDPNNPKTFNGNFPDTSTAPFPNTVHAIRAVQIASLGQVLNANGDAIEEVYSFMARDID